MAPQSAAPCRASSDVATLATVPSMVMTSQAVFAMAGRQAASRLLTSHTTPQVSRYGAARR